MVLSVDETMVLSMQVIDIPSSPDNVKEEEDEIATTDPYLLTPVPQSLPEVFVHAYVTLVYGTNPVPALEACVLGRALRLCQSRKPSGYGKDG